MTNVDFKFLLTWLILLFLMGVDVVPSTSRRDFVEGRNEGKEDEENDQALTTREDFLLTEVN